MKATDRHKARVEELTSSPMEDEDILFGDDLAPLPAPIIFSTPTPGSSPYLQPGQSGYIAPSKKKKPTPSASVPSSPAAAAPVSSDTAAVAPSSDAGALSIATLALNDANAKQKAMQQQMQQMQQQMQQQQQQPAHEEPKSAASPNIVMFAVLGVLGLAGVGVLVYALKKK